MTTAIVPYKVQPPAALLPTNQELGMIKAIAKTASAGASLLPKIGGTPMTEGQAAVVMLYGRELGVQPLAALSQIYVVNNRPQPSAQLLAGLMQSRDPHAGLEIIERTTEKAKVRITYKGRSQDFEATMEDAKRADLLRNPTWSKYPKQMLVWTAVRTGVRLMAPDAINALAQLPTLDQVGAMMPEGDYIEGETVDVSELKPEPTLTDEGEADITPEPEAPGCEHPTWKAVGDGAVVCTDCGLHRADVEAETAEQAQEVADAQGEAAQEPSDAGSQGTLS